MLKHSQAIILQMLQLKQLHRIVRFNSVSFMEISTHSEKWFASSCHCSATINSFTGFRWTRCHSQQDPKISILPPAILYRVRSLLCHMLFCHCQNIQGRHNLWVEIQDLESPWLYPFSEVFAKRACNPPNYMPVLQ